MPLPDRALALLVAVPFAVGSTAAPAGPRAEVAFTFADPAIVESSGLALVDDLVATVNDSGDRGRVFAVDPATGRTVGVTSWAEDPTDVEAVATAGPGEVWVGDIGDNRAARDSVSVLRVPLGRGTQEVEPERYELIYPDGATDAESLAVDPATGRLVVVGKGLLGGVVYLAPGRLDPDRPNRLQALGTAPALATDAAFLADGRHLVVRGYGAASVLTWPALETVGRFDLPEQDQGEGLAVSGDRLLLSTEGAFADVLRMRLPRVVREAVAPASPSASPSAPHSASVPPPASSSSSSAPGPAIPWSWVAGGAAALVAAGVSLALRRRGN